jgi:GH25 family lysozyme M1 (1,4-beta-N-acetylmuramidase)
MDYLTVCDISRHNGKINFDTMIEAGAVGVAIRATIGAHYTDPRFYVNWDRAESAGLLRTAYHVTKPSHSIQSQIDRFFGVVGTRRPDFGIYGWVADNELSDNEAPNVITKVLWAVMSEFTDHAGKACFNYGRTMWLNYHTTKGDWDRFPLWVAYYDEDALWPWGDGPRDNEPPRDYDDWDLWQWSTDNNLRGREFGAIPEPGAPEPSMDINRAKAHIFQEETPPTLPDPIPEPVPQPDDEYIAIVDPDECTFLNIRSEGVYIENRANVIGGLRANMPVTVLDDSQVWWEVRVPEFTGFMHSGFLKRV